MNIKYLRENIEKAKLSQEARGQSVELIDEILELDKKYVNALQNFENLRAKQNEASKKIASASKEEKPQVIAETKALSAEVNQTKEKLDITKNELESKFRLLPNIIEGAPAGGEKDFIVLEEIGEIPNFDFELKDHLAIGENIGAINMVAGAKVSGSRFYFLKGIGFQLELALINMGIDLAIKSGFTPMITPTLVRPEVMQGTGFIDEHDEEVYRVERDDQYLVGTSEVALAGYFANERIDVSKPIRFAGLSTCYRREAGSYGKDVRGIIRVHQFNKVEMFAWTKLEDSFNEHLKFLELEKQMLKNCELPFRVIDVAAGDLGTSAARKYDCEAWLPSQERYMEVTSTSNCTTFQANRLQVRDVNKQAIATLNGTLTTTRWLVAILENHQRADGSINIPKALQKYMPGNN